ncbi:hypothetical protein ABK040_011505 [Willaertia magna]
MKKVNSNNSSECENSFSPLSFYLHQNQILNWLKQITLKQNKSEEERLTFTNFNRELLQCYTFLNNNDNNENIKDITNWLQQFFNLYTNNYFIEQPLEYFYHSNESLQTLTKLLNQLFFPLNYLKNTKDEFILHFMKNNLFENLFIGEEYQNLNSTIPSYFNCSCCSHNNNQTNKNNNDSNNNNCYSLLVNWLLRQDSLPKVLEELFNDGDNDDSGNNINVNNKATTVTGKRANKNNNKKKKDRTITRFKQYSSISIQNKLNQLITVYGEELDEQEEEENYIPNPPTSINYKNVIGLTEWKVICDKESGELNLKYSNDSNLLGLEYFCQLMQEFNYEPGNIQLLLSLDSNIKQNIYSKYENMKIQYAKENYWKDFMSYLFRFYLFDKLDESYFTEIDIILTYLNNIRYKFYQQNNSEIKINYVNDISTILNKEEIINCLYYIIELNRILNTVTIANHKLSICNFILIFLLQDLFHAEIATFKNPSQCKQLFNLLTKVIVNNDNNNFKEIPFQFSPTFIYIYLASSSFSLPPLPNNIEIKTLKQINIDKIPLKLLYQYKQLENFPSSCELVNNLKIWKICKYIVKHVDEGINIIDEIEREIEIKRLIEEQIMINKDLTYNQLEKLTNLKFITKNKIFTMAISVLITIAHAKAQPLIIKEKDITESNNRLLRLIEDFIPFLSIKNVINKDIFSFDRFFLFPPPSGLLNNLPLHPSKKELINFPTLFTDSQWNEGVYLSHNQEIRKEKKLTKLLKEKKKFLTEFLLMSEMCIDSTKNNLSVEEKLEIVLWYVGSYEMP